MERFNRYVDHIDSSATHAHREWPTQQSQRIGWYQQVWPYSLLCYVITKKDGQERFNFTSFYEALLEAKGINLSTNGECKPGRKLSYVATVQSNGNLLIVKAYTALLDLQVGDEFEINLGRKQIRLVPAGDIEDDND